MISPHEIRDKAACLWAGKELKAAHLSGNSIFPMEFSALPPIGRSLYEQFADAKTWIQNLRAQCKDTVGKGYVIQFKEMNSRRLGRQSMPARIVFETLEDCLFLAGKEREFGRFKSVAAKVLQVYPDLLPFFLKKPAVLLDHEHDWEKIFWVCDYILKGRANNLFMRQMDIPGIDTKFIEAHLSILSEILGVLRPAEDKGLEGGSAKGIRMFEQRFGLRREAPSVRFRLLDQKIQLEGLTDLTVSLTEFRSLSLPIRRVFIVENKMNFLCFPESKDSAVIFGMGYGAQALGDVAWLEKVELYYWGDIDTHGFSILSAVRSRFPKTKSLMMDQNTLLMFKDLWGDEKVDQRFLKDLGHLNPEETTLFEALKSDLWATRLRLEQERIGYAYVQEQIATLN